MKKSSEHIERYYLQKDELLRRLGVLRPFPREGERSDIQISFEPGQQSLSIIVTTSQPETDVPEPQLHRGPPQPIAPFQAPPRDVVIHQPPLTGERDAAPEKEELRKGHLEDCDPWCQRLHPDLGGYQPGPRAVDPRWPKPIPRDHSLDQDGPGDPI